MALNEDCIDCKNNDMCQDIKCKDCTWNDFKEEVRRMIYNPDEALSGKEWVFRGLLEDHCLKTTLERFREYSKIPWGDLPYVEAQIIREAERKAFGFGIPLPLQTDKMWWVSLMQHYGAPTRLLDWSYSPYVAAYFAFEKLWERNNQQRKRNVQTEDHVVVWAIQYQWTRKPRQIFRWLPADCTWEKIEKSEPYSQDFLFDPQKEKSPFIMQVNTHYLHDRLTIQQGVFQCPTDVSKPFMDNFRAMGNYEDSNLVIRLRMSSEAMREAMAELHKMNITRNSLFPGFQGFAESLKLRGSYFRDLATDRLRKNPHKIPDSINHYHTIQKLYNPEAF